MSSTQNSSSTGDAKTTAKVKADQAHQSDWVDRMAVVGLITFGVVHLVIGWLAVQLAFGDAASGASSTGAVKEMAQKPFGQVLVWLVALGMLLLVAWRLIEAALGYQDEENPKRIGKRLISVGRAIVYGSIAFTAIDVAIGKSGKGGGTDSMTATLMDRPGGQLLVAAVGVAIVAVGIGFLVVAYRESYLQNLDAEGRTGGDGKAFRVLGRVGHVAKGLALGVVGGLFLYAAATHEAKKSGGLDQALRTVRDQSFGPILLIALGLGFAAYGLFCFAQARHLDR